MGWSWALYFASEAVRHRVSGRGRWMDSEVVDRAPTPALTPGRALSGTYVDNICMIGVSAKVVCERMAEI